MGFEKLVRRLALTGSRGWLGAFGSAMACVLACALLRAALTPLLGSLGGSTVFLPGVIVAGLWAGRRGAYMALAGGIGAAWVLAWLHPDPIDVRQFLIGVLLVAITGWFTAEIASALRRAFASEAAAVSGFESGEQRLRMAHEAGALGTWEWDVADDTLILSDGYLRNWRILKDDTLPFLEVARKVHPDDYEVIMEARRRVLEDGDVYHSEYRVVGEDGAVRWFTSRGEPVRDAAGKVVRVHGVNRDITDQKLADQSLRESEERFRTMANSAPSPVWVTRPEGGVEFVNEGFSEFFGLNQGDLLGDVWVSLLHPDDRDRIIELSQTQRLTGQPYAFEARFRNAAGEYRWVQARCRPRLGAQGQFMGYVGIAFDTTASREAEAALRESEARFRLISDRAPVNLWMGDETGACVYLNTAQREFWGLGEDYLQTFTWAQTLHEEDAPGLFERFGAAMEARQAFEVEARYRRADGEWRILHTRAQPRFGADNQFLGMIGVNVDVTEARQAEEVLRESEARFRAMADSAPAPIWVSDLEGGIAFVNQATKEFFGPKAEAVLADGWRDRLHPDDVKRVHQAREAGWSRREAFAFEARFKDGRGQWRWLRATTRPRFDNRRDFLGYIGIAFDVTEAREAQDYLRAQERRQRFLLQLGDGLRETDEPRAIAAFAEKSLGQYLRANRVGYAEVEEDTDRVTVAGSYTDASLEALQGVWSMSDFGPKLYADLKRGRTVVMTDAREDPRTAEMADSFAALGIVGHLGVPVFRGGKLRALLFVHQTSPRHWTDEDVALVEEAAGRTWTEIERARALADVRESEARFRSISDSAPILVWVTNADRQRAFVNKTYVEFMGGGYDAALNGDWRKFLHPDDWDRILKEQIAGEASLKPFSLEARYKRADGMYRWLRSFSRPRFAADQQLLGFVGAAYDVTEERQVQADLEHINELLAERVSMALAEKEQAEAALIRAQKLEALGRLTGGVAHDFNNLLTVVVGALDMILKHPHDEAKRTRMATAAMAAARRGEQLTHQLLAFSRRQALRPALSDINALIRESEPLIRRTAGEQTDFTCDLAEGQAVVRVDPAQFEAALFNLVVNAKDATPDGGAISVTTARRTLAANEIAEVPAGDHIVVTVGDTGAGMSSEVISRVFEPFFTTKPQGKGTGLGLSQVYGFAQQSGGGVSITSIEGKGTSVSLFLPAMTDVLPAPADTEATAPEAGPMKILLVEDDFEVAAVAETMLRHLGHEVTRVSSAARALAKLRSKTPYDLLLTDVVMPGQVNGVELAHRAAEMRPGLKIVLTSGYAGEAVDETLVKAPWPFLRKPYSQQDLATILDAAMARPDPGPAPKPTPSRKPGAARPRRKSPVKS